MARSKKTPFQPWETKTSGIEQRYIRLGNSQLLDQSIRGLGDKAFRLYAYMRLDSGGRREFEMPYARIRQLMPISRPAIKAAVTELEQAGLIEVAENNANLRKPNLYRFSTVWRTGEMGKAVKGQ